MEFITSSYIYERLRTVGTAAYAEQQDCMLKHTTRM